MVCQASGGMALSRRDRCARRQAAKCRRFTNVPSCLGSTPKRICAACIDESLGGSTPGPQPCRSHRFAPLGGSSAHITLPLSPRDSKLRSSSRCMRSGASVGRRVLLVHVSHSYALPPRIRPGGSPDRGCSGALRTLPERAHSVSPRCLTPRAQLDPHTDAGGLRGGGLGWRRGGTC